MLINQRTGIDSSFNLAKPAGKAIMGLTLAILLLMPLMGPWINSRGDQPIYLQFIETQLVASRNKVMYTSNLSDIERVKLLEEKLSMMKVNGTGLENLELGKFSAKGYGSMEVCIDPTIGPFLYIQTKNEQYLLGSRHPEETTKIYDALQKK